MRRGRNAMRQESRLGHLEAKVGEKLISALLLWAGRQAHIITFDSRNLATPRRFLVWSVIAV